MKYKLITHLEDKGYRICVFCDDQHIEDLAVLDAQVMKARNSLATGLANQGHEVETTPIPERLTSR
jgi:hypothetical protein